MSKPLFSATYRSYDHNETPNGREDMLELMREYADVFAEQDVSFEEFAIMCTGYMDGVLCTDKIADCINGSD